MILQDKFQVVLSNQTGGQYQSLLCILQVCHLQTDYVLLLLLLLLLLLRGCVL